jgi:RimJ/RimL family protein N-acetyltransferase
MKGLQRIASPVVVEGEGLVLREWDEPDAPFMVDLFDTAEIDRWTPLESPFDLDAAQRYVHRAHRMRDERGSLQLAITEDGSPPLGEVLAFPTEESGVVELAYAVGAAHQGRGLARRSVLALLPVIAAAGVARAILRVDDDNLPSRRVAEGAGFVRTAEPLVERRRKGYVLRLLTWERRLDEVTE